MANEPVMELGGRRLGGTHNARLLTAGKKARAPSSRCSSQRRLLPCSAHEGDLVSCFLPPEALLGGCWVAFGASIDRVKTETDAGLPEDKTSTEELLQ